MTAPTDVKCPCCGSGTIEDYGNPAPNDWRKCRDCYALWPQSRRTASRAAMGEVVGYVPVAVEGPIKPPPRKP